MSPPPFPRSAIADFSSQTQIDRHFMALAYIESRKSDDPKAIVVPQSGVGAIIVKDGIEISKSANVLPPRIKSGKRRPTNVVSDTDRYFFIEHAERAAIFEAWLSGKSLTGATLYCSRFPCSDCARAIAWSGIKRVVLPTGFAGERRWIDAQRAALRVLRESGVVVRYLGDRAATQDTHVDDKG